MNSIGRHSPVVPPEPSTCLNTTSDVLVGHTPYCVGKKGSPFTMSWTSWRGLRSSDFDDEVDLPPRLVFCEYRLRLSSYLRRRILTCFCLPFLQHNRYDRLNEAFFLTPSPRTLRIFAPLSKGPLVKDLASPSTPRFRAHTKNWWDLKILETSLFTHFCFGVKIEDCRGEGLGVVGVHTRTRCTPSPINSV